MKKHLSVLVAAGLLIFVTALRGAESTPPDSPTETPAHYKARMQWWNDARFGMFIHWGIYSKAAGYWDGKPTSGPGEWIMNDMHIPRSQYAKLASHFDPVKFNADRWVHLAHDAGMKYLVITAKHHDGFCMFRTKTTHYNVVDDTPWGKDPLEALDKACHRYGIRFATYYSIRDWHTPDQAGKDSNDAVHPTYQPSAIIPGKNADYIRYMKAQLKELITQYHPAILWFDGGDIPAWTRQDGEDIYNYVRELEPSIIINNRLGHGIGDYGTPEQHIPPNGMPGRYWETCMTINDTWGYKKGNDNWKSTKALIHNLIDIASKGGNYLLNVGPTAEGVIPQPEVERLEAMGRWLKVNGEAIYGTAASPFTKQLPWGRCTQKPGKLYLEVFDWPSDSKLLVPIRNHVTRAYLRANPSQHLETQISDAGVVIKVPTKAPDSVATVVVVSITGKPRPIAE